MSSSTSENPTTATAKATTTVPDYNGVEVAKTGGKGAVTASEKAAAQDLSLGAPRARPSGGHYLTKGGIQVTANVDGLEFSKSASSQDGSEAVIENLIEKLDSHKGVLLTSSYEFPGRYARWSLGFIDPPLEISGKADKCTIKALNDRGKVLLPAVEKAMQELKEQNILADVKTFKASTSTPSSPSDVAVPSMVQIEVTVVPPPEVGTFNEEERSRQVRNVLYSTCCSIFFWDRFTLNTHFPHLVYVSSAIALFGSPVSGRPVWVQGW
jgi:anthranilate synthase